MRAVEGAIRPVRDDVEIGRLVARELEPALADRIVAGVHYPAVQTVTEPLALTEAVLAAFRDRGGRVVREAGVAAWPSKSVTLTTRIMLPPPW